MGVVQQLRADRFLWRTAVLTSFLVLAPLGYYLIHRTSGGLGDRGEWLKWHNHGPWRWTASGWFIYLSLLSFLVLTPTTFVVGLIRSIRRRSGSLAAGTALLVALQLAGLILLGRYLFWTID
jgi:hypothetical protein